MSLAGWRTLAGALACLALGLALLACQHRPAEDDPGWDCRTMGNHQCGATP